MQSTVPKLSRMDDKRNKAIRQRISRNEIQSVTIPNIHRGNEWQEENLQRKRILFPKPLMGRWF
jgi:hypothetical protein